MGNKRIPQVFFRSWMYQQDLPWNPLEEVELVYATPDCWLSLGTWRRVAGSPALSHSPLPDQDNEEGQSSSG